MARLTGLLVGLLLILASGICAVGAPPAPGSEMPAPAGHVQETPRKQVHLARATWDTGWFQAEILKILMEDLNYEVAGPRTMDNQEFYLAAAKGEVDLWANGWFPTHNVFMEDPRVKGKLDAVGFEVKGGALEGYLVDKKSAESLGISMLTDLKDPSVASVFDRNGNGKADLIGCNAGWGCELSIEHQLDAYGLRETVEHVQGDYGPMMLETVDRYHRGEPVLFFTWTPNWTVGALVPGRDTVWLQVPFPSLPEEQQDPGGWQPPEDISGCEGTPCNMGFPANDIRMVANRSFLQKHPDINALLKQIKIPLDDISRQNARMVAGEGAYEDIRRHAREWIRKNRERVDKWLQSTAKFRSPAGAGPQPKGVSDGGKGKTDVLRVATLQNPPFVIYQDRRYSGFSIDLWDEIARLLGTDYEVYGVNTIAKLLDEVKRGAADVAVSGIGITSEREKAFDFSHSFFDSGLQVMVPDVSESLLKSVTYKVFTIIFAPELLFGIGLFGIILLIAAHAIWVLEGGRNPQFSGRYLKGIWEATWWAVVTVTTVGYGDKTPKGAPGRLFGLFWILAGYFVFAYFTASVTSTVTVEELHGTIGGPEDLFGKRVATVEKSTAAKYLAAQGISSVRLENAAAAYEMLAAGEADALVYDAPVLQHYAAQEGRGKFKVVGLIFQEKSYGIALPVKSPQRDRINVALLKLMESGAYQEIKAKWFGS